MTASQPVSSVRLPFSPVICYHQVLPRAQSEFLYNVAPEVFADHIRLLSDAARTAGPRIAVTFDDGHASIHQHALPVLERFNLPATLFITTGWAGSRPGYLSWSQLAELAHLGHAVESHGCSHALLTHCDDAALAWELRRSKQTLEDRLGRPVTALSLPGGRGDDRVLAACAAAGYQMVYTSDPYAYAAPRQGVEVIGRFMARRDMPAAALAKLLAGNPAPLRALHRRQVLGRRLKALLGDHLYHWLWTRWAGVAEPEPVQPPAPGGMP